MPDEPFKPFFVYLKMNPRPSLTTSLKPILPSSAEIVEAIDDPWLKARLADLVWLKQRLRNHQFALAAIDSYRTIPLDTETWLRGGGKCWQRAIGLARMLGAGAGDRLTEMEASIFDVFGSVAKQNGFLGFWLADLLKSHALGSNHAITIATKLETLARGI